jgi:adenylate cyclase
MSRGRPSFFESLYRRVVAMGVAEDDSEGTRLVKGTFTLVALATAILSTVWVLTYLALGVPRSAAIPFIYQILTVAGLVFLARTKRFALFHNSQLTMYLVFPFLLMWSLGGFANGSAVAIWAVAAHLIAVGSKPWPWLGGFLALALISGVIDSTLAESAPAIPSTAVSGMFVLNFAGPAVVVFVALEHSIRERNRARAALDEKHAELEAEQERSEALLLNILPAPIAERLKTGEEVIADRVSDITVLFADIVGFTSQSRTMPPQEVVQFLNQVFGDLDDLADRFRLDKIKTLGDGYMAVGNATEPLPDHLAVVLDMALSIRDTISGRTFGDGKLLCPGGLHHRIRSTSLERKPTSLGCLCYGHIWRAKPDRRRTAQGQRLSHPCGQCGRFCPFERLQRPHRIPRLQLGEGHASLDVLSGLPS